MNSSSVSLPVFFNAAILVVTAGALTCVEPVSLQSANNVHTPLLIWIVHSRSRKRSATEGIVAVVMVILMHTNTIVWNYLMESEVNCIANTCPTMLTFANMELQTLTDLTPSSIGRNAEIDRLTISPQCEPTEDEDYHWLCPW
jgi:hypothetical protein